MSREEVGRSKVKKEENKRVLRSSKKTKKQEVPVGEGNKEDSDNTEVESELETPTGLGVGESFEGDTTVVENPEISETSTEAWDSSDLWVFDRIVGRYIRKKTVGNTVDKRMFTDKEQVEGPPGSTFSLDSGMSSTQSGGMDMFLRGYMEEQRRRDDRREEQLQREREENRAREDRLWSALGRIAPTPEPEPRSRPVIPLPMMKEKDEITEFLPKFEAALTWGKVPREQWREQLVSHMPIDSLMKAKGELDREDSSYEEVVSALSNSSTLTFGAAAEDLCTGERGRIWELEGRKAAARIRSLLGQVTREADNMPDMLDCLTVALLRDKLVPNLKGYVDSARRYGFEEFLSSCEEWERVQPNQTSWFRKRTPPVGGGRVQSANSGQFPGSDGSCAHCSPGCTHKRL